MVNQLNMLAALGDSLGSLTTSGGSQQKHSYPSKKARFKIGHRERKNRKRIQRANRINNKVTH